MTIPGHAPRPASAPNPENRHLAPFHRDAGLDRIARLTRWTVAGGLALTGGFAVAAAAAQPGGTHTRTQTSSGATGATSPTAPAPTPPSTEAPSTTTTAPPPTTAAPQSQLAPPPTSPPTTQPPTTLPPTTRPPMPTTTIPRYTYVPPIVVSGGS